MEKAFAAAARRQMTPPRIEQLTARARPNRFVHKRRLGPGGPGTALPDGASAPTHPVALDSPRQFEQAERRDDLALGASGRARQRLDSGRCARREGVEDHGRVAGQTVEQPRTGISGGGRTGGLGIDAAQGGDELEGVLGIGDREGPRRRERPCR